MSNMKLKGRMVRHSADMRGLTAVRAAVVYDDIHLFDPSVNSWTQLSPASEVPTARHGHGLAAAANNMLYLFGGVERDGQ